MKSRVESEERAQAAVKVSRCRVYIPALAPPAPQVSTTTSASNITSGCDVCIPIWSLHV